MTSNLLRNIFLFVLSLMAVLTILGSGRNAHAVVVDVQVSNFQQQTIYDLPPDPAYPGVQPYSSWVGMWKLPGGTIQCDFVQATGPQSNPTITFPVLQTTNAGQTWTGPSYVPTGWSRGMAVFPGDTPNSVTMVRPDATGLYLDATGHFQYPNNNFMGIQRSTDGGQTWSPSVFVSPDDYQISLPTVIKPLSDGRLVCMAGLTPSSVPYNLRMANITKTMFISTDQGQTWGSPITIMPPSAASCEESDFVELPGGDLLWVHRSEQWGPDGSYLGVQGRVQSISRKDGDTFVSEPPTACPLPPGGFPCDLMTREGVILDLGLLGSHWSGDQGQTWHDLIVNGQQLVTPYYPQAVQADDGTIVLVGHVGSDDTYGATDQSIVMQSFRLNAVHSPEPSTSCILGIGVLSLLCYAWRRHKRAE